MSKKYQHLWSANIRDQAQQLAWDEHGDKSGPFSMYDMCHDIADLLSDSEWNRYQVLPREQKVELREHAHDVTVNAIFKMMGC